MVKKDLQPILKESGEKPTIDCPHCFAHIRHVEVVEERHGIMNIGGEIESTILLPTMPGRDRRSGHDTRSRASRIGMMTEGVNE